MERANMRAKAIPCVTCGQRHSPADSHEYDYVEDIDDDLTCQICLQPFVTPVDLPCQHTFCQNCLKNYLKEQTTCPIDRVALLSKTFTPSSLVLKKWMIPSFAGLLVA